MRQSHSFETILNLTRDLTGKCFKISIKTSIWFATADAAVDDKDKFSGDSRTLDPEDLSLRQA